MQLSAISLAITRLGFVWNPMQLFSNGEQGAWYDPSDLSTLWQDSAATTPVTAVEQPVGLMLDKSKGLVLGSDVKNVVLGASWSQVGDVYTNTGTAFGTYLQLNAAAPFKGYSVTVEITSGTVSFYNGGTLVVSNLSVGVKSFFVQATATIQAAAPVGGALRIISVKELPGNHAKQATSTKRGTSKATGAAKWIDYDAIDDVLDVTFPSSLGLACTVGIANVGAPPTILTAQSIGTSYAMSTDNAGLIIVNRALTASETAALTTYLTAKGAT